jgi:hypothetical protein
MALMSIHGFDKADQQTSSYGTHIQSIGMYEHRELANNTQHRIKENKMKYKSVE